MNSSVNSLSKLALCFFTLLACSSTCVSQAPSSRPNEETPTHIVQFQLGSNSVSSGDMITIDQILGTTDTITPGHLYEIKGKYRLSSRQSAKIAAQVTTDVALAHDHHQTGIHPNQIAKIKQGDGQFDLFLYFSEEGEPHIAFYPLDGGTSFGGVYFKTGAATNKTASPPAR